MVDFLMFFVTMMVSSVIYAVVICKIPNQIVREAFLETGIALIICGFVVGLIIMAV